MMPQAELRSRFLVALLKAHQDHNNFEANFEYRSVAADAAIPLNETRLGSLIEGLRGRGLIVGPFMKTYEGIKADVRLTDNGIEEAEKLAAEMGGLQPLKNISASDRYVSLDHNRREYVEFRDAVDEAIKALSESNQISPQAEMLLVTVLELNAGRRILEAPLLSVELADRLLRGTLVVLAKQSLGAVVGAALKAALNALGPFFEQVLQITS